MIAILKTSKYPHKYKKLRGAQTECSTSNDLKTIAVENLKPKEGRTELDSMIIDYKNESFIFRKRKIQPLTCYVTLNWQDTSSSAKPLTSIFQITDCNY